MTRQLIKWAWFRWGFAVLLRMRRATCVLMASLNFLSRFSYAASLRSVSRGLNTLYARSSVTSQYESIKEQYPDYILLFQVGDFYEIFGKDAGLLGLCICAVL